MVTLRWCIDLSEQKKDTVKEKGDDSMAQLVKPTSQAFILDKNKAEKFFQKDNSSFQKAMERLKRMNKPQKGSGKEEK